MSTTYWLNKFPTVDIVRCEDCKHWGDNGHCDAIDIWIRGSGDFFCSRGERSGTSMRVNGVPYIVILNDRLAVRVVADEVTLEDDEIKFVRNRSLVALFNKKEVVRLFETE